MNYSTHEGSWKKSDFSSWRHETHETTFLLEGDPKATAVYLHNQTTNYTIVLQLTALHNEVLLEDKDD